MPARFVSVDRDTRMVLPPDLRGWVPEDDLVHFVIEVVDRLPLESFRVNYRGTGDRQFPPHMMLALLIYSYANGVVSSRKIGRVTHRDVAVRLPDGGIPSGSRHGLLYPLWPRAAAAGGEEG